MIKKLLTVEDKQYQVPTEKAGYSIDYDYLSDEPWSRRALIPLSSLSDEEWLAERLAHAIMLMRDSVEISPNIRGGVPVLRGTRMPLSMIIAEIADSDFVDQFAADREIDSQLLKDFLHGISIKFDCPFIREPD